MCIRVEFTNTTLEDFIMDGPRVDYVIRDGFRAFIERIVKTVPSHNNESDSVNHPSHYNQNGMEVWDVIKAFTSNLSGAEAFYAGNVIKYVLRWKHKNGIEDLEKAKVYIDKIIEIEKEKQIKTSRGDIDINENEHDRNMK